tara:strand:- start:1575 stop:1958 length:384 start_codon:yes stop_codon:yes gene_type:complete
VTDPERFQLAGWRTEASNLKKKVREQEILIIDLNKQLTIIRNQQRERFGMILFPRNIEFRREHLITLHNVMEHIRRYGNLTPNTDFTSLGFNDHRTLHRTCNKFVEFGILTKTRANPTTFELLEETN